ncbi:MAG: TauD/TfdA family dioxygenase [Psychrosphaera sp.]|nr:TauD/TfdA family dioxygenase [Psychrosphaera sp.]
MDLSQFSVDDLEKVDGQPLILRVTDTKVKAVDWVETHKQDINRLLDDNGALLIRGLKIHGSKQFAQMLGCIFGGELLEYTYRSTPRMSLRNNIYTATEYPANQIIPQHNENAYSRQWPNRIGFVCMIESKTGGETPIGSSRFVYQNLPSEIRERFEALGILYVRNYFELDLPWTEVFQTQDKAEVEAYCRENQLEFEWIGSGLRTKQVNPATAVHPATGETLWFNQAHLFHVSNLEPATREMLLATVGEENFPRQTYYGDGSPIEPEYLEIIRDLYEQSKIKFSWQKGDLMVLDNMKFTHGREQFEGERKILVGMGKSNLDHR